MKIRHLQRSLLVVLLATAVLVGSIPIKAFAQESLELPAANQFGKVKYYSTATPGKLLKDSYAYNDQWFMTDPAVENPDMALLSMQLIAAACESDAEGPGGQLLEELGFSDIGFRGSHDATIEDCNYTYGKKQLSDGSTLVAVVIQSYAFDSETKAKGWQQNFLVNGEHATASHYGFQEAVNAILPEVTDLTDSDSVRYWITGQSRGGAIANILAASLPAKLDGRNQGIYAYTFEAPTVIDPENDAQKAQFVSDYPYIHNYICTDDIVPRIPVWGMMRYGYDHELNTTDTDAALETELECIGSDAQIPDEYNKTDAQKRAEDIVKVLEAGIPTRASYYEVHEETVMDESGEEIKIEYQYQSIFRKLMGTLFGGVLEDFSLESASDHLSELLAVLEIYVRGYLTEVGMLEGDVDVANRYYWKAAISINNILKDDLGIDLGLTDGELYVILRLVAPALINKDAGKQIEYDPTSDEEMPVLLYLAPALQLKSITFSHQFDTVIARLKTLASTPDIGDIAITIDERDMPTVSDPVSKMPRKIKEYMKGQESSSWMAVSAEWDTSDSTLKKNKTYYLDVTFEATGHNAGDEADISINDVQPVNQEIARKNGITTILASWAYTFGEPKDCPIYFDVQDIGEAPETMYVKNGTVLKYVDKPEEPVAEGYHFMGWYDFEKKPWDEITVSRDTYLEAHWLREMDKVEVAFDIPRIGQGWKKPSVVGDEACRIEEVDMYDESYLDVTTIETKDPYILGFTLILNHPDRETFKTQVDEEGYENYVGTVLVNGEEADINYDAEAKFIRVSYTFTPLDAEDQEKKEEEKKNDKKNDKNGGTQQKEETKINSLVPGISSDLVTTLITAGSSDKDQGGTSFLPLMLSSKKTDKNSISLSWNKAAGADSYVIYGALSGNHKMTLIGTTKNSSYTVKKTDKKLKKGKYYKFILVALDKNKKLITASSIIHAATTGSKKAGNYSSLTLTLKKAGEKKYKTLTSVKMKKGKTAKLKVKGKNKKGTKVKKILKIRYVSSNPAIATVSSRGKIKAVGTGKCMVYAYSQNGVYKGIKVTVRLH